MMMRRYRYVEDGLTIGNPETDSIVAQTERNVKLWNRVTVGEGSQSRSQPRSKQDETTKPHKHHQKKNEPSHIRKEEGDIFINDQEFKTILENQSTLLFPGMADMLLPPDNNDKQCKKCRYKPSYGIATVKGEFGGVRLCGGCEAEWGRYIEKFPERAGVVFPFLLRGLSLDEGVDGKGGEDGKEEGEGARGGNMGGEGEGYREGYEVGKGRGECGNLSVGSYEGGGGGVRVERRTVSGVVGLGGGCLSDDSDGGRKRRRV